MSAHLSSAEDTLAGWLRDLGVSPREAQDAKADVSKAVTGAVPALLGGVVEGISALSSLAFFPRRRCSILAAGLARGQAPGSA